MVRNVIISRRLLGGLATVAVLAVVLARAAEPSVTSAVVASDANPRDEALAAYVALSASQASDYDRRQDISPRQLVILLDVAERTGASLGQALATGEHESARTWNDHVRPTLKSGGLGAATGVWQFQPATFHNIVKIFGAQLLAASEADAAAGLPAMDLGAGPFTDAQVRGLIQETVEGQRGADDAQLQLLRHNFAVLAFAKHYLSIESGATTPEEDYLFHFLGEGQGRRILALARGETRDTLCVKPVVPQAPADEPSPGLLADAGVLAMPRIASELRLETKQRPALGSGKAPSKKLAQARETKPSMAARPDLLRSIDARSRLQLDQDLRRETGRGEGAGSGKKVAKQPAQTKKPQPPATARLALARPADQGMPPIYLHLRGEPRPTLAFDSGREATPELASAQLASPWAAPEPALFYPMAPVTPAPVSSEWGLPADSPTVTGNLGMFYRDGTGQTQPYTWAEFLEHLGMRVWAADQPVLVRAKYGVGFALEGGDMPGWAFDPDQASSAAAFRNGNGREVLVPEAMVTGTLDRDETRRYKERLAELVSWGEDQPLDILPPEALAALHHLGLLLDPNVPSADTRETTVQQALHDFRKQVGKDEPDDPEHSGHLMPAERVALELYEQRIAHYAALQVGQDADLGDALDLNRIGKLPARFQRMAAPYIAALQAALADLGLLTQPTRKTVWRDKQRKKHTSYKTVPFAGRPNKATLSALNTFQLRHGLRQTDGVADAVTLDMLGLPPTGLLEVFLPPTGPRCASEGDDGAAQLCEVPTKPSWGTLGVFIPNRPHTLSRILNQ